MKTESKREKENRKKKGGERSRRNKVLWRGRHPEEEAKFFSRVSEDYWKTSKMAVRAWRGYLRHSMPRMETLYPFWMLFLQAETERSNFAPQSSFSLGLIMGIASRANRRRRVEHLVPSGRGGSESRGKKIFRVN
ncbi:hypothetical protein TNCV_4198551 [Trichonephila clavipes]|nr:hypothetical protein TNCV_4198551 [Trichonephila clavipes]